MQKNIFYISKADILQIDFPMTDKIISYKGGFEVNQKDIIILTGMSGAGKSTFLKVLKGIIPRLIGAKVSGTILFKDFELSKVDNKGLLQIGYLSQNPFNQIICDTVFNELAFGLENLGFNSEEIDDKINIFLNKVGLIDLKYRKTNQLSGGEAQIINLISLLLLDLDILLLDEPTALLDPKSAQHIVNLLQNKTIVVVEHNSQYFQYIATEYICLNEENIFCHGERLERLERLDIYDQFKVEGRSFERNVLEIKNLSFAYESKRIFENVNLTIGEGEIVGIMGAIGSGKSTLIQLILGILPSQYMVYFYNKPIESLRKVFDKIGVVWQNSDLHFFYDTVKQETDNLEKFGLSYLSAQSPFSLSEGEKKRLAIAITFAKNVDLMLLDEPTFGQDSMNIQMIKKIILDASSSGRSILITSHNESFLRSVCDKVYSLESNNLKKC